MPTPRTRASHADLRSFDDLGPLLIDVEFVVFDLETTGTSAEHDAITEIGAVRVVGGEVIEEFQSFVNPEREIPALIARLTGITNYMVKDAPTTAAVIPAFLEFARTSVLVAHNARFDVGFLKAATLRHGYRWPGFDVVDTLALARSTFGKDEVPNHRLSTLAAAVGARTIPNHRALSDARATVDVLHAIIERLGPQVSHLSDLTGGRERASAAQIAKRHLCSDIPAAPGVYSFVDASGTTMYVGKSGNLRSRVRSYFSPQEKRRAILDMMPAVERIETHVYTCEAEASIRELRLIAQHKPRANRQGIRASRGNWLRLGPGSQGLRLVRTVVAEDDGTVFIGPLRSKHDAEPLRALVYASAMASGHSDTEDSSIHTQLVSDSHHERMRSILVEDPDPLFRYGAAVMRRFTERGLFENAAALRTRIEVFVHAAARAARLRSLASVPRIVAARRAAGPPLPELLPEAAAAVHAPARAVKVAQGGDASYHWDVMVIHYGRLAHACHMSALDDPLMRLGDIVAHPNVRADDAPGSPLGFGHHQETEILAQWLASTDVRLVHIDGSWSTRASAAFTMEAFGAYFRSSGAAR